MNRHPTDEELLDALAPGAEPAAGLREHLATCPACRARVEAERPLDDALGGLAREADPPRDLWPGVRDRIAAEPRGVLPLTSGRRLPAWLRAAAAVALFLAGAAVGRGVAPGADEPGAPAGDPLAAAAEVQRAGTAYVEAVARFRATAGGASGPVIDQARDVALAAVHGAAWELERLRPDDATATGILALADRDRAGEVAP